MKKISLRTVIQIVFFVLIAGVSINNRMYEYGYEIAWLSNASIHAVCPFGGVVSVYSLISEGDFIRMIHESSMVLLGIVMALAVLFGPVFCGWVCPLGSIQDLFSKIGKKFKLLNRWTVPIKIDKVLRHLRYVVLLLVIIATAKNQFLIFANIDPYNALFTFWTGDVKLLALAVLVATLIAALFIERPWCKYLCPFGAFLGIFNKIRIFKIRRNENTCINCKLCDKACPMNIKVSEKGKITDSQCITCLKCTSEKACPVENTVELKI